MYSSRSKFTPFKTPLSLRVTGGSSSSLTTDGLANVSRYVSTSRETDVPCRSA